MAIYNTHQQIDIYVYSVKGNSSNNTNQKSVNPNAQKASRKTNSKEQVEDLFGEKRAIHNVQRIARFANNMAVNVIPNALIGQIANATGDTNYQALARRKQEYISDVCNPIMSIANSTASGMMIMGPLGALTGFLTSFGTTAISMANKYESRNINYAVDLWKQNQSLNYNKARASIDLTDGRTRLR